MKKLLYFFLPLLALVACTEGGVDDNNNPQPEAKIPINISTSITRATDSDFEIDDKIGLYVVNQPNTLASSGNHVDNVGFTYSGEWIPDEDIYWKDQTTKADFYAYYPYSPYSATVNTSAHSFSVKADQSAEADYWASDFMWGKTADVSPTTAAVPIMVNHMFSNMHIYLKAGNGFTEESLAAANISVKINNVKTAASIDLSSGIATAEGEATTITPWNTGEYYRAMVVPQTVARGDALITITIDEEEYVFAPGLTLLANKQHKIVLTIDKTAGGINVNIGNWDVVEENFDGSPEIRVTAACSEDALKSHVYDVFQDAIESFTSEDGVYVITLKEGCTTIPDYAFSRNSDLGLTSVVIGNGVTSIGSGAFENCVSLTSVAIPDSVTLIGDNAFWCCFSLTSVTIPDSVTEIERGSFGGCTSLTSVTIPDSVTSIGDEAFRDCESLTSIIIPDSVTSIGEAAFNGCDSLTSIKIGNGVTEIKQWAFIGCSSLTNITIPNSVTVIGNEVFSGCKNLQAFYGKYASEDNRCLIIDGVLNEFAPADLITYNIPNNVTSIGFGAFKGCSLINVIIPYGVTSIGEDAFRGCRELTYMTIPNSVTSIGCCAYAHCVSLIGIILSDSVAEIGYDAFNFCQSLEYVYCKPVTPPTIIAHYLGSMTVFDSNASERKIYVPQSSIDAYKTADGWATYADAIVGYDFE